MTDKKEDTPKEEEKIPEKEIAPKEPVSKEGAGDEKNSAPKAAKEDKKKEESPKEDKAKDVEVPKKFKSIVEEIEKMSVLDLSELVHILEDKFGVSAAAPVMMGVPAVAGGGGEQAEEEKSLFNVELTETGSNKIGVIKAIRSVTSAGLKEAKDMAEGAPAVVVENASKEDAEKAKKALEEAGAKVTLK